MVQISRSKKSSSRAISIVHIFLTFLLCAFSFYTGTLSATSSDCSSSHSGANDGVGNSSTAQNVDATKIEAIVQQRLQAGKLKIYLPSISFSFDLLAEGGTCSLLPSICPFH